MVFVESVERFMTGSTAWILAMLTRFLMRFIPPTLAEKTGAKNRVSFDRSFRQRLKILMSAGNDMETRSRVTGAPSEEDNLTEIFFTRQV